MTALQAYATYDGLPIQQRRSKMSSVKNVMCDYPGCGKQFYHTKNLKRHAREKHPDWMNSQSLTDNSRLDSGANSDWIMDSQLQQPEMMSDQQAEMTGFSHSQTIDSTRHQESPESP